MHSNGVLYVVGTPIGNLEDITLRALRVLSECDVVICEDTRVTKKLLSRHGIGKPVLSFHAHSSDAKVTDVIRILSEGKVACLVTDAGTPGISDPGAVLVREVRKQLSEAKIETVPGPSALTAFLSVSGVPVSDFLFLGFLPHKKGRQTLFADIAASGRPVVFYESPHRILKTLHSLTGVLSQSHRVTIGRELTKKFEEIVSGGAEEVYRHVSTTADSQRGEFVVLVTP